MLNRDNDASASASLVREVPRPVEYMLKSGMLFELNRVLLHPVGFSLEARPVPGGRGMTLALLDYTADPVVTFDPDTFQMGQRKWRKWYREIGAVAHNLRRRKLGLDKAQSSPNYRARD